MELHERTAAVRKAAGLPQEQRSNRAGRAAVFPKRPGRHCIRPHSLPLLHKGELKRLRNPAAVFSSLTPKQ